MRCSARAAAVCSTVAAVVLLLRPVPAAAELTGIWADPDDGPWQGLEPTAASVQAMAEFDRTVDDPVMRCVLPGFPRIIGSPFPVEIIEQEHQILILYELFHADRRVYLDGRAPPDWLLPSKMGFSVGRWEDDVLVVETTHLAPALLTDDGLPIGGPETRVTERIWRSGDVLEFEVTVEDPVHLEQPTTMQGSYRYSPGELMIEYACDPRYAGGE